MKPAFMLVELTEKRAERLSANQPTQQVQKTFNWFSTFNLLLVDYATIIYLSAVTMLLLFSRSIPDWQYYALANLSFIGFLLIFIRINQKSSSRVLQFFRDTYPFFVYTFMFKEIAIIINLLFPFWLEQYLIDLDKLLFSVNPTVWVQQFYTPALTEFMAFSYWSYYILFPIVGFTIYFQKDKKLYHSFVFALSVTLYFCYFSYLFLGARGPHETLEFLHAEREYVYIFDKMVKSIQDTASISGAAFPSSHVAAMWIILFYAFKFKKPFGWILLPVILSLSISVVYLQYHYAVDSIAGILLACGMYPLTQCIEKKFSQAKSGTYLDTSFTNVE